MGCVIIHPFVNNRHIEQGMGNTESIENPDDITARELKVGSKYQYYERNGKLGHCRTLKVKRSLGKKYNSYSLGWDMGWKIRKGARPMWGGIISARKDVRQFRPCVTRKKKKA